MFALPRSTFGFELRLPIDCLTSEALQIAQNPPNGRVTAMTVNLANFRFCVAHDDILSRIESPAAEADLMLWSIC